MTAAHNTAQAGNMATKEDVEFGSNVSVDEELEPVVTPKTWIVVFVHLSFFPFLSCCRSVLEY